MSRSVRLPAVAGSFYEAEPARLSAHVSGLLAGRRGAARPAGSWRALLLPHAGHVYSGSIAAAGVGAVAWPAKAILLGPNHDGTGAAAALSPASAWRTPLGDVPRDASLAADLLALCPALEEDETAHRHEHSLEVLLPFLQKASPSLSAVFTSIGEPDPALCLAVGHRPGPATREGTIMKSNKVKALSAAVAIALGSAAMSAGAAVYVQCPGDNNGDAIPDAPYDANALKCMHLTAGDGFIAMAHGKLQYTFGFNKVTGVPEANVMSAGMLAANFPAPTIVLKEGQEFYLTLSNVGMAMRPDLADPHSVHFHGFPNASSIFEWCSRCLYRHHPGIESLLLLQPGRARHLHVSLPRGGDRAHADGHAGRPGPS